VFFGVLFEINDVAGATVGDSIPAQRGISAGINFSSRGIGVSVTKSVSKRFDIRLNGSYAGYTYDIHKLNSDLRGDAILRVGMAGCFADFYLARVFYFSGGAVYNFTHMIMNGQSSQAVEVGDIVLEPNEVGDLGVKISPGWKINPYLGLGLSSRNRHAFNVGMEMGLFFQNAPDVELTATGLLSPTASLEQEQLMEKNISPLVYYPYFSLRLSYYIKFKKR